MARTIIRGRGITQREDVILDTADDVRQWVRSWNADFKEAGSLLGAKSREVMAYCEEVLAGTTADGDLLSDSPEAFAFDILQSFNDAQDAIKQGEADLAARHGWEAAFLAGMAIIKWDWEKHALRGAWQLDSSSHGGKARAAVTALEEAKRLDRMEELKIQAEQQGKKFNAKQAACKVAKERGGGSPEHLRQKFSKKFGKPRRKK